jgi:hypothetical protein
VDSALSVSHTDGFDLPLQPGSEHRWPGGAPAEPDLALLEGEVALIGVLYTAEGNILRRRTLCCWDAPCLLPALLKLPEGLELRFKVVRAASVVPLRSAALQRSDVQACVPVTLPQMEELLRQLAPPSPTLPPASQSLSQRPPAGDGTLATLVLWLAERHGTRAVPLPPPPLSPSTSCGPC